LVTFCLLAGTGFMDVRPIDGHNITAFQPRQVG
jgi:hypothetical protein